MRGRRIASQKFWAINLELYDFIVKDDDLDGHVNIRINFHLSRIPTQTITMCTCCGSVQAS